MTTLAISIVVFTLLIFYAPFWKGLWNLLWNLLSGATLLLKAIIFFCIFLAMCRYWK